MNSIRQCFVCSLPVPRGGEGLAGWEAFRDPDGIRMQYRRPKHRTTGARLATIGDSRKVKLNSLYGRFGK